MPRRPSRENFSEHRKTPLSIRFPPLADWLDAYRDWITTNGLANARTAKTHAGLLHRLMQRVVFDGASLDRELLSDEEYSHHTSPQPWALWKVFLGQNGALGVLPPELRVPTPAYNTRFGDLMNAEGEPEEVARYSLGRAVRLLIAAGVSPLVLRALRVRRGTEWEARATAPSVVGALERLGEWRGLTGLKSVPLRFIHDVASRDPRPGDYDPWPLFPRPPTPPRPTREEVNLKLGLRTPRGMQPGELTSPILRLIDRNVRSRGFGPIRSEIVDFYRGAQLDGEAALAKALENEPVEFRRVEGFGLVEPVLMRREPKWQLTVNVAGAKPWTPEPHPSVEEPPPTVEASPTVEDRKDDQGGEMFDSPELPS